MDQLQLVPIWKRIQPFAVGGAAGMAATVFIQPVDMVKVRLQLNTATSAVSRPTAFQVAKNMVRNESVMSLYKGLSAGLLRQATYTTARMGLFNSVIAVMKEQNQGSPITFTQRACAGLMAGGIGALVGTPADVALVRMQSDGVKPVHLRQNYRGVMHCLTNIVRQEGIQGMYKGAAPTIARAMALNLGMLSTYAEAKNQLESHVGVNYVSKLGASATAGFLASFFSLPFDFVKTRLQQGSHQGSALTVAKQILQKEGFLTFYRGFGTYYMRIAPHAMMTLLIAEGLHNLVRPTV